MAEVTNDLIYEVLKKMQSDVSEVRHGQQDIRQETNALRGHMLAMPSDIHNIYGMLTRHDTCLDRNERRLEFRELAEPQRPFDLST